MSQALQLCNQVSGNRRVQSHPHPVAENAIRLGSHLSVKKYDREHDLILGLT